MIDFTPPKGPPTCQCGAHHHTPQPAPPPRAPLARRLLPSLRMWKRVLGALVAFVAALTILSTFVAHQIHIYFPDSGINPPEFGSVIGDLARLLMVFLGGG